MAVNDVVWLIVVQKWPKPAVVKRTVNNRFLPERAFRKFVSSIWLVWMLWNTYRQS